MQITIIGFAQGSGCTSPYQSFSLRPLISVNGRSASRKRPAEKAALLPYIEPVSAIDSLVLLRFLVLTSTSISLRDPRNSVLMSFPNPTATTMAQLPRAAWESLLVVKNTTVG